MGIQNLNAIITLNWNTTDSLIRLYESLKKTTLLPFNFIIVDNGSECKEYDKLKEYFVGNQQVILYSKENNVGFAAGNNIGLNLITFEQYVFFINSDVIVEEQGWDKKFVDLLSKEDVGVVGCAYHPLVWDKSGHFHIQPIPEHEVESESVQGAFFGSSMRVLNQIYKEGHFFDEDFKFAHYEETDLCFRIMELKYKCYWIQCKHIHEHHKSATKKNGFNLCKEIRNEQEFKANSEKNRQLLIRKHQDFFNKK